jgi:hypothetical protein
VNKGLLNFINRKIKIAPSVCPSVLSDVLHVFCSSLYTERVISGFGFDALFPNVVCMYVL